MGRVQKATPYEVLVESMVILATVTFVFFAMKMSLDASTSWLRCLNESFSSSYSLKGLT